MKLATILALASLSISPQIPELDEPVPDAAERVEHELESFATPVSSSILTSSSQTRAHYRLTLNEAQFTLGVAPDDKIVYIWTDSKTFQTPEGVKAESSLEEALGVTDAEVVVEVGWGCFLPLPSGWNAYISLECPNSMDDELFRSTKVEAVFKRRGGG